MRALLAAAGVVAFMASPALASTVAASVTDAQGTHSYSGSPAANQATIGHSAVVSGVTTSGSSTANVADNAVFSGLQIGAPRATGTVSGASSLTNEIMFTIAGATASTVTRISILFTTDFGYALAGADSALVDYTTTFTGQQVGNAAVASETFTWHDSNTGNSVNSKNKTFSKLIEYDVIGSSVTFAYSIEQETELYLKNGNSASTRGGGTRVTFNIPQSPVPEPATWAMMIAGFGLVGAAMRRRAATTVAA